MENKLPLVTVIIPSYNRIDTVSQTLDSIISQRCNFEIEIVVGDDYSTDGVREVLQKYHLKYKKIIRLLFHERNIGLGANWAKCVLMARGKYIANCDNDDYWHEPNKLQLQVDFMESNPIYGLCHTDYRIHNRNTNVLVEKKCENSTVPNVSQLTAVMNGYFRCCNATVLYRREVLMKYINLEDYVQYQFTLQDWNTWMLLANHTKFFAMHISTATFGVETESITRPNDFDKLESRLIKEKDCFRYVCDKLPNNYTYNVEDYEFYANRVLLSMAYNLKRYEYAKRIASRPQKKSLKYLFSKNKYLFVLLSYILMIKKKFKTQQY